MKLSSFFSNLRMGSLKSLHYIRSSIARSLLGVQIGLESHYIKDGNVERGVKKMVLIFRMRKKSGFLLPSG